MDKITKQNALNAHTWVGVFLSVLLFLVCLSGTVAVFHLEFERWEQPHIEEMKNVSPEVVEKAMDTFLAQNTQESHHLYVVFPTSDIPRLVVENDHAAYFADSEGNLLEQESVSFTEMLVNLHLYLNLPQSWGMILVSALGAIICTLVVTGIIAHKRIAKDALTSTGWQRSQHKLICTTVWTMGSAFSFSYRWAHIWYGRDHFGVVAQITKAIMTRLSRKSLRQTLYSATGR